MRQLANRIESEQGSVLIEVLVSSILLVITAVGVFSAFDAATRSTSEQRHRAQAHGLAQTDLARLRTMRVSALSNLHQTKVVTIDETPYTVESLATFRTDATGTASCDSGSASADYIEIRSTVTWPSLDSGPAVVAQSLVAPPNGSISAKTGSLAIQIVNAENDGIENVGLNGTGAGTFGGVTGSNGCAIFGNLPEGEYTLSLSGPALIDRDGQPPQSQVTSVVAESVNTLVLQYDEGGAVAAEFETWVDGLLVPSSADAIVVYNSGLKVARVFGTPGTPQDTVTATPLFPFASTYSVYAGSCEENNPSLAGESAAVGTSAEALITSGGETAVTIVLPGLHLTVWSGTGAGDPGERVKGATVKVADTKCTAEEPLVRTFTTDSEGELPDPGLPYSTYGLCVSDGTSRVVTPDVPVPFDPKDVEGGTAVDVYLDEPSAQPGTCP